MGTPHPLSEAELQAAREGRSEQVLKGKYPVTETERTPHPLSEAELQAAREGKRRG